PKQSLHCYSRAVQIEPDLAEAYYKRAIAKKLLAR
ncbi:MAG: tetratricopeptide repeat protein, partial [Pseudanabaena sp.]